MKFYIDKIDALKELEHSIHRFCINNEDIIWHIDSLVETRIDNLKKLESYFQSQLQIAEENKREATANLYSCESDSYEDEDGNSHGYDCSSFMEVVNDCRKKIEKAEENYSIYKRELQSVESSIFEYHPSKNRFKATLESENDVARDSLTQIINGAEDYVSVSLPNSNSNFPGLGLTEAVAKIDPTMIIAATVGVAEIIVVSMFSFFGLGGSLFSVSNKSKKGLVTTTFTENGTEHICSELKIEKRETGNIGKIVSVNIPPSLQSEKIGKHLINNMEATCRANGCKEISGWANSANVDFYQGLNYQTRNDIKGSGAEVFKPLDSKYSSTQNNAKLAFEDANELSFKNNTGKQEVNPLHIISPDEINEEKFWKQHDKDGLERYIDQIEKYDKCKQLLKNGNTIEEIRKSDFKMAIAYDNFVSKGDTIRLLKNGDYYKINGSGRHRVAAAQIYFLRTGRAIPIEAEITENR